LVKAILNTIGVKRDERSAFVKLYLHSFLNGIFISFFATVAYAQFLNLHDSSQLPIAFLLSGLSGYLLVWVYSKLQKRIKPASLYLITLVFLLVLMVVLRGLSFYAQPGSEFEKYNAFILFVAFAPAQQLLFLEFGGVSLQLFDIRQGKRFFGLISTGDILAAMLGFLIIPILIKHLPYGADDLLFMTIVVLIGCIAILKSTLKLFPSSTKNESSGEKFRKRRSGWSILKDPYVAFISLLSLFSVLTAFFSDFLFLGTTKLVPDFDSELRMAQFISLFFGVVKVIELALSLLSSRILAQFGMKTGITLFPLMMLGIIIIASVAGIMATDDIFMFFILVAISQVIDRAVRKGIDIPSFRTLYQPMPADEKLQTQTFVDGTINQGGVFVSGLFLLIVGSFIDDPRTRMVVFTVICIPFMLAYFIIAARMFRLYKNKLRAILEEKREIHFKNSLSSPTSLALSQMLSKPGPKQLKSASVVYQLNPYQLESQAKALISSENADVVLMGLKVLRASPENDSLLDLLREVSENPENALIRHQLEETMDFLGREDGNGYSAQELQRLCNSEQKSDKMQALKHLSVHPELLERSHFLSLIQSTDDQVIRSCIHLVSAGNLTYTFSFMNDLLRQSRFRPEIIVRLALTGNAVLPYLEQIIKRHFSVRIKLCATQVCALMGTKEAGDYLLELFFNTGKWMQLEVGAVLNEMDYKVLADEQRLKVKELLRDTLGQVIWIEASLEDLKGNEQVGLLEEALTQERKFYITLFYELLGLIEDKSVVELIRENVAGEEKVFALEIIDNFVSEDLKEYLVPIVGEVGGSQTQKTKNQFLQKTYSVRNRLRDIINHDYNKVNPVTKSLAIEALGNIPDQKLPNEVFAGLFHPDQLLSGAAAKVLIKRNDEAGMKYLKDGKLLPVELVKLLQEHHEVPLVVLDRIYYFMRLPVFRKITRSLLLPMARGFEPMHFKTGQLSDLRPFYNKAFVVFSGDISISDGLLERKLARHQMFVDGIHFDLDQCELIEMSDAVVLVCDHAKFISLASGFQEMLPNLIERSEAEVIEVN